jgi:2-polyprenyl-6-methoxyphenol hydroxylase-like FAD-dependent oxidoreductase
MSVLFKTTNSIIKTDICIVGGGSVGLIVSQMLRKYKLNHLIFEKDISIVNHPKAHYISPRSTEIFKYYDIPNVANSNQISNGNHYRYCSYLLDNSSYLGEINHFESKY